MCPKCEGLPGICDDCLRNGARPETLVWGYGSSVTVTPPTGRLLISAVEDIKVSDLLPVPISITLTASGTLAASGMSCGTFNLT
jgi:hypothetical protein